MEYETEDVHFKILSWKLDKYYRFEDHKSKTYKNLCIGLENFY